MSEVEEVAKAVAELSKFGTQSVKTTEKILAFLARVFNEPVRDVVGIIGEKIKYLRWERQIRMADEVDKILKSRKITSTRTIPLKYAIPIIENASLEEDDNLQNLWIKLLANWMDPNFKNEIRFSFVEIIKSLTPLDAKILESFYIALKNNPNVDMNKITEYSKKRVDVITELSISLNDYYMSIHNLFRVQCLAPAIKTGKFFSGNDAMTSYKGTEEVVMTHFGKYFIEACRKE